jgi:hypothetical protein
MFPGYKGITRYDKVEINIPNGYTGNYINVPDQPQLRSDQTQDVAIQAIETFTQFDQALSDKGAVMPTVAQLIATMLILYIEGEQSVFNVPLTQLHRCVAVDGTGAIVPHVRDLQVFDNVEVSWDKCQLFNPANLGWNTGGAGTFSFMLGVHYIKLPPGTMAKVNAIKQANYCNLPSAAALAQMGRLQ